MNKIIKSFSILGLSLMATSAMAQNTESGYFTQGYIYAHEMNPAIAPTDAKGNYRKYVSMPLLGNFDMSFGGDINLENYIFNRGGKTVTFLHPDVSASEFMSNIEDKNNLDMHLKLQIFSMGFKGFGGYNTIGINVHSNVNLQLPGDLFSLAKEGLTNKTYNLSDINAHTDEYVEIALGHSHKINDKLNVGGKVKFLLGAANMDLNVNNAVATLGADGKYSATVDAELHGNMKGLQYKTKGEANHLPQSDPDYNKLDEVDVDGAGLGGFGLAFDLGATYQLNDDLRFSASLLDLGFINWNTDMVARAKGSHTIDMNDYSYDTTDKKFSDGNGRELKDAFDDFKDVIDFKSEGDKGSRSKALAATLNLGAEYTAPFYRKLTFGLLYTNHFGTYSNSDFRLSANVAPVKCLSAGVNVHTGSYGTGFGWIVDFHPKGFGLFLAMDDVMGKTSKQFVPLKSNAEFSMGINFPL